MRRPASWFVRLRGKALGVRFLGSGRIWLRADVWLRADMLRRGLADEGAGGSG